MVIRNQGKWLTTILFVLLILCVVEIQSKTQRLSANTNRYTAISAGWDHCMALKTDGSIEAWGDNEWGKAEPPDGNDFVAISAGYSHSLALRSNGNVVQWGYDSYGKFKPPDGNDFVGISAGYGYCLALRSDGSITGWGNNDFGVSSSPEGNDFIAIAANGIYSLALRSNRSIVGWGHNANNRLNVPKGNDFIAIAAGSGHSLALKSNGSIVGWGVNFSGEANSPAGNDYVAIATGDSHSLALKSDGSIICWGSNIFKQAEPPKDNGYVAIAAGAGYSLALKSDGSIVGWGKKTAMVKPIPPKLDEKKETEENARQKDIQEVVEIKSVSSLKTDELLPETIRLAAVNEIKIDLIYIEPGSFKMGIDAGWFKKIDSALSSAFMIGQMPDEWPFRKVKITKGFYIGKYKVTCRQFCAFLNSTENPRLHICLNEYSRIEKNDGIYVPKSDCENCAINNVRWRGAKAFCEWLGEQSGFVVRLPTEAEWEFVARGPENRHYPWGEDENVKFYEDRAYEYEKYPHPWSCAPVDAFPGDITPDGVAGMAGAGGEWCSDFYLDHYLKDDVIDPQGPTKLASYKSRYPHFNQYHVYRSKGCITTNRGFSNTVGDLERCNGLRIVVEIPTR